MVVIKTVSLDGTDIRRFTLHESGAGVTYASLCERIAGLYNLSPALFASGELVLQWRDQEDDPITIASTDDLVEAIRAATLTDPPLPLRATVVRNPSFSAAQPACPQVAAPCVEQAPQASARVRFDDHPTEIQQTLCDSDPESESGSEEESESGSEESDPDSRVEEIPEEITCDYEETVICSLDKIDEYKQAKDTLQRHLLKRVLPFVRPRCEAHETITDPARIQHAVEACRRFVALRTGATEHSMKCDSCPGDITGTRFKCATCPEVNLCSACEKHGLHPQHVLYRIVVPLTHSVQLRWSPAGHQAVAPTSSPAPTATMARRAAPTSSAPAARPFITQGELAEAIRQRSDRAQLIALRDNAAKIARLAVQAQQEAHRLANEASRLATERDALAASIGAKRQSVSASA